MLFVLKPLARTLILPPAGPLLIAIVGFALLRRRPRLGKTLVVLGLAMLWVLATPVVADSLLRAAERYPPLDISKPTNAQAIVVLGGSSHRAFAPEYRSPSVDGQLLERVTYASFLAKRTHLPILVSGTDEETVAMSVTLARNFGEEVKWIENRSRDTYENARYSVAILKRAGVTHILLVTSGAHIWRATNEFRSAGVAVTPAPAVLWARDENPVLRWVPSPAGLMRSHIALYELIGESVRQVLAALHIRS